MKIINRGSFFILFFIIHLFADRYNFKLICNKQKIYLGEEFKIEFRFSYDNASKIAEVNFSPPLFQNLHIKEQNQTQTDFSQSWIYILSAFKDKNISIPKAYLDIAIKKDTNKTLGHFDDYDYDYITLETKPLALKILQNHDKTNLYGKFDINSTIKKENNIIYLTINISGEGNFEDIGEYKLNIKNATIYSNKPIYKNNLYQQNFAIVSDQSFTIPSFEISYIDKKNNKKITKKTKPIFIKIDNKNNKKTSKVVNKRSNLNYIFNFLSLFFGILIGYFISKFKLKKTDSYDLNLYQKIKNAKDKKSILNILLSYNNNQKLKKLIHMLEDDIYITKSDTLTKKEILKFLKN